MSEHNSYISKMAELFHDYIFEKNIDYYNLEDYLEAEGIEVYYAELDGIDGYLRINSDLGTPRIVVKANQYAPRQRFTMAHELGHLILHHKYLPWKKWDDSNEKNEVLEVTMFRGASYSVSDSKKENEANQFAAEFLMPYKKIMKIAKNYKEKTGESIKVIDLKEKMVDTFYVSAPAAARRIEDLINDGR